MVVSKQLHGLELRNLGRWYIWTRAAECQGLHLTMTYLCPPLVRFVVLGLFLRYYRYLAKSHETWISGGEELKETEGYQLCDDGGEGMYKSEAGTMLSYIKLRQNLH